MESTAEIALNFKELTMEQQQLVPERDLLKEEFEAIPLRTQFMPVWFGVMNALLIVTGVMSIIQTVNYLISYSRLSKVMRVELISFMMERLDLDIVYILTIVPAVMFLIRNKQAVYWGIIMGMLRVLAVFSEMVFHSNSANTGNFQLFLRLLWIIGLIMWTVHAFRIRKKWLYAQPGNLFK